VSWSATAFLSSLACALTLTLLATLAIHVKFKSYYEEKVAEKIIADGEGITYNRGANTRKHGRPPAAAGTNTRSAPRRTPAPALLCSASCVRVPAGDQRNRVVLPSVPRRAPFRSRSSPCQTRVSFAPLHSRAPRGRPKPDAKALQKEMDSSR